MAKESGQQALSQLWNKQRVLARLGLTPAVWSHLQVRAFMGVQSAPTFPSVPPELPSAEGGRRQGATRGIGAWGLGLAMAVNY